MDISIITKVILKNYKKNLKKRKIDPFNRKKMNFQKSLFSNGKWSSQPKYHCEKL